MLRKVTFVTNSYYHVYNRGVEKRDIFFDEHDHKRFLALLYLCNSEKPVDIKRHFREGRSFAELFLEDRGDILVDIGAYCLMKNHFHLLIRQASENGISMFMKKLGTAYSMYFNKKNDRSGILFQGKFKATIADKDEYLKYLFAYIHLNPVKLIEPGWKEDGIKNYNKARKFLDDYSWSSYSYFTNAKKDNPILNVIEFPDYFNDDKEFSYFIDDFLQYQSFTKEGPS